MEKYTHYLDKMAKLHIDKSKALSSDNRQDESSHERIMANIYEVCLTTYLALDRAGRLCEYKNRLESFRNSWETSREKAACHNESEKVMIEEIKLAVLLDAQRYLSLSEEK